MNYYYCVRYRSHASGDMFIVVGNDHDSLHNAIYHNIPHPHYIVYVRFAIEYRAQEYCNRFNESL